MMRIITWIVGVCTTLSLVFGVLAIRFGDPAGGLPGILMGLMAAFLLLVIVRSDRRDR